MLMVYTSFPILGHDQAPSWVGGVEATFKSERDVVIYNPRLSMKANDDNNNGRFYDLLNRPMGLDEAAKTRFEVLHLGPELLTPFDDLPEGLIEYDECLSSRIVFRDLYILIRAFMLIADANSPSFGGVGQEVLYAHLLHKPVVVVSDRYAPGPWMLNHCDAMVPSKLAPKEIAIHLMAYQQAIQNAKNAERDGQKSAIDSVVPSSK